MTDDLQKFMALPIPIVVLDSYFETFTCDTVLINNEQGAYIATRYLFQTCKEPPGYLKSSCRINNYLEMEAGKRIPEDIAIVGFDNIPISQVLDLTTINVPKEYLGQIAAERFFARIRNPKLPTIKLAVETALIDRYSC